VEQNGDGCSSTLLGERAGKEKWPEAAAAGKSMEAAAAGKSMEAAAAGKSIEAGAWGLAAWLLRHAPTSREASTRPAARGEEEEGDWEEWRREAGARWRGGGGLRALSPTTPGRAGFT
jgi:hypothetical protein